MRAAHGKKQVPCHTSSQSCEQGTVRQRTREIPRRPVARRDSPGTGCLTIPIVSSILEIEKESLPVRRLAQVNSLLKKVAAFLGRGGYFFMLLKSSTSSVAMIAKTMNTRERISKSLKSSPSLLQGSPQGGYVNRKVSLPGEDQPPTVFWQAPAWYSMQIHHNRKKNTMQPECAGFCLAVRCVAQCLGCLFAPWGGGYGRA